jgi:hypothetical protein
VPTPSGIDSAPTDRAGVDATWSHHALVKAELLRVTRTDVERLVLEGHQRRTSNTGAADWLVGEGRLMVAYNHPHRDDVLTALVVTLWRRA